MHQDKQTASTNPSSNEQPMNHPNERSEMSFDRSQHELEQLRYYCMEAGEQQQASTNHVLEVFLTFVSTTDSRMNKRQAVYIRQQQSLRDVLGPEVLGRFSTEAMAFVYKAQQIRDVGQTAAQLCLEDKSEVSVTWLEDVGLLTSGRDDARNA